MGEQVGLTRKRVRRGTLIVELVEVGGLDPRVPVTANWPVSLVVGHNENDVGFFGSSKEAGEEKGEKQ